MFKAIFIMSVLVGFSSFAGLSDYLVYDYTERVNNKDVDVVVKAKVNKYYAFSGVGLAYSFIRSTATNDPTLTSRKVGPLYYTGNTHFTEIVYDLSRHRNCGLQLKNNSIWLLDVNVEECFSGNIETNHMSLIMKPTRAFKYSEFPDRIYSHYPTNAIIFKLRKMAEEEVAKSFEDHVCYIKGDYFQEGKGYVQGFSGQIYGHEFGDLIDVKDRHFFSYRPTSEDDHSTFLGEIFNRNFEHTFHGEQTNNCYVVVDVDLGREEDERRIRQRARELRKKYGRGVSPR